jgi:hypothetical protein
MTQHVNAEKAIDYYAKRLNKTRWQVVLVTGDGIQARRLKQVNKLGVWSGLLLLPFWGIGFVIWLLVLIDYWLQQEKIVFITVDQMIKQLKEA